MVRQKLRVYENTELLICKEQWTEKALAWDLNDANNQAWQSLICLALHISLFCYLRSNNRKRDIKEDNPAPGYFL
jgi:hypothetical protein